MNTSATPAPAAKRSKKLWWWIGGAVAALLAVLVVAIVLVADRATQDYGDYARRVQVVNAMAHGSVVWMAVMHHEIMEGKMPESLDALPELPPPPAEVKAVGFDAASNELRLVLADEVAGPGAALRLRPAPADGAAGGSAYVCVPENIPPALLPERCRNQSSSRSQPG
ncbi:MAG: hypothetical protein Q4G71_02210 [Pseudomonadota bacterium]|nr:hypothetical protein [Pseudomonadota bacterium]